jgi:hypothetical protein
MIKIVTLVLTCLIAQGCLILERNIKFSDYFSFEKINVVWEQKPRSILYGSDAQLNSQALEDMNLLYLSEHDKETPKVYLAQSIDAGKKFSNLKKISSNNGKLSLDDGNSPHLGVGDGGEIFATWEEDNDIKFARSSTLRKKFLPAVRVNDDLGNAVQSFHTMKVTQDGTIFIFWVDGRNHEQGEFVSESIFLARSLDNGKTFERNIRISGGVCNCCRPAIAFGKTGQVFLSWHHEFPGDIRKVVVVASQNNGLTWSKPIPVSNRGWQIDGCINSGPAMAYINGKLYVAWFTGAESKSALRFAWSGDEGASFHQLGKIQKNVSEPNYPCIENINGEPWVIFQGTNAKNRSASVQAWIVKITSENKLSLPQAISNDELDAAYPHLYRGENGSVFALWTALTSQGPKIMMAKGKLISQARGY